jgi:NAD(P)-dependent dehydrogenase (short-subunit alcohol dehydrogenase family)
MPDNMDSRSGQGAVRPYPAAAAVAFLAWEKAHYITAHTLSVSGGRYSK